MTLPDIAAGNGDGVSQETADDVAGSEADYSYTYDGIEEWDEPIPTADGTTTVHDVMDPMAKEGTDMEAFAHSELGEFAISSSYLNNHIGDITSEEVVAYWAERGMANIVLDYFEQYTTADAVSMDSVDLQTFLMTFSR